MKPKPDPRSGPKNDVAIWVQMTADTFGPGIVLNKVKDVQVAAEREQWTDVKLAVSQALLLQAGACAAILKSARDADPATVDEKAQAWKDCYERGLICMHNLEKLPDEIRAWRDASN